MKYVEIHFQFKKIFKGIGYEYLSMYTFSFQISTHTHICTHTFMIPYFMLKGNLKESWRGEK